MNRTYALITPARDERENLHRLVACLREQTIEPTIWVIVDDGSSDGSREFADELARGMSWVRSIAAESSSSAVESPAGEPDYGRRIAHGYEVRAFNRGFELVSAPVDFVVKVDADVSFEPNYFERLFAAFDADPSLGIASGVCLELEGGAWMPTHVTEAHVRGATRCYRWACLQAVLPLAEDMYWDTLDELKAQMLGWRTGVVPDIAFLHHRKVGERDGRPWSRWLHQGDTSYFMGYRFSYLVLRALNRMREDPAAVAMVAGYVSSWARRSPRYADPAVRQHLRERQRVRNLRNRAREALGRDLGTGS
jgi:biofilm PGA synthesis N-glycosyltransferase PgaC